MTHNQFLSARAILANEASEGWKLACLSVGCPVDTVFYAGETDTPEWIEYNSLMTNYLGFCREYEQG